MKTKSLKINKRIRRHAKIRTRVFGTETKPRLSVFKSNTYVYAQLIDDTKGVTVASADSRKLKGKKVEVALKVGGAIAKAASAKGVKVAVFDRGGFKYTGRIKALAEGARENGLSL